MHLGASRAFALGGGRTHTGMITRTLIACLLGCLLAGWFAASASAVVPAQNGAISGTVTDASSHVNLENVDVVVYDSSGDFVDSACTASDGTYTVSSLPAATYTVQFAGGGGQPCGANLNYQQQWYSGKSSQNS